MPVIECQNRRFPASGLLWNLVVVQLQIVQQHIRRVTSGGSRLTIGHGLYSNPGYWAITAEPVSDCQTCSCRFLVGGMAFAIRLPLMAHRTLASGPA